jgi:predicted RNA methylase
LIATRLWCYVGGAQNVMGTLMFAFGQNWDSFPQLISEDRIRSSEEGLLRLFPNGELRDKPFLDIGCGSGLSMVAALRLGASEVHGIDVDANSVSTSRRTLELFSGGKPFSFRHQSVFELSPAHDGTYPIVYSWGVLHHTGAMWKAIERAAEMVGPKGYLAIALYRSTPMCSAWKLEKRLYSRAPATIQKVVRGAYKGAVMAKVIASGKRPADHIKDYNLRGMSWSHDVHDWLGGYPYESTDPKAVISFLGKSGLTAKLIGVDTAPIGLMGTGCKEYVATRDQ